jgi:hypothetical protein
VNIPTAIASILAIAFIAWIFWFFSYLMVRKMDKEFKLWKLKVISKPAPAPAEPPQEICHHDYYSLKPEWEFEWDKWQKPWVGIRHGTQKTFCKKCKRGELFKLEAEFVDQFTVIWRIKGYNSGELVASGYNHI